MKKALMLLPLLALAACTNPEPNPEPTEKPEVVVPGEGNTPEYRPTELPSFAYEVTPWSGQTATDVASYPADDPDLNPELTEWNDIITVTYSGATATVSGGAATVNGANVDLALPAAGYARIVVTGRSDGGSLRITGNRKHLLELDNLTLTATDRPAINDQVKKRSFIVLKGHSRLEDGAEYLPTAEDRKGCYFAEDHIIIGGDGVLEIKGNYRHGLATDGFLFVNPGASLVVTDAAKNAIHVKGSASENNALRGIEVTGGYVYAHTSAPAGKAMKCDAAIRLRGGRLELSCTGEPAWDDSDASVSSPGCVKSDVSVSLSGADVTLTATGAGAKCVNSNGTIDISGGKLNIAHSGGHANIQGDSSTPKGLASNGKLTISGGGNSISAIGATARAIDADGGIDITGGVNYLFGTAWGLRTVATATVTGGVLLSGGAENCAVEGIDPMEYADVDADSESVIMTADGSAILASYRWPVALPQASLLLRR